jgi:hypothetical protein
VDRFHTREVLKSLLSASDAKWPSEIRRLYNTLAKDAERGPKDLELLEELRTRANSFSTLPPLVGEEVETPWHSLLEPGVVSYRTRRFVVRDKAGLWIPVPEPEGLALVLSGVAEPLGSVRNAYAMAAAVESGSVISSQRILEALIHPDPKVRLAGLWAAEQAPDKTFEEPLLTRWREIAPAGEQGSIDPKKKLPALFGTLKETLFGERERILLALRALVKHKRDVALRMTREKSLPPFERAWLVAELGDTHLLPRYHEFFNAREAPVAAVGLYGSYLTAGKKYLRMASEKSRDSRDLVRCVAQHILEMEKNRSERDVLPDGKTGSLP